MCLHLLSFVSHRRNWAMLKVLQMISLILNVTINWDKDKNPKSLFATSEYLIFCILIVGKIDCSISLCLLYQNNIPECQGLKDGVLWTAFLKETVRKHESLRWYDIVHFEHKLSRLCFLFSPKGLMPIEMYSLLKNPWSFSKLANVGLPTFLHKNHIWVSHTKGLKAIILPCV